MLAGQPNINIIAYVISGWMANQYSTSWRAGNAALLIAGMALLFFITSVILIALPNSWAYLSGYEVRSLILSDIVWYGIGGALLFFWWKTRPIPEEVQYKC